MKQPQQPEKQAKPNFNPSTSKEAKPAGNRPVQNPRELKDNPAQKGGRDQGKY